MCVESDNTHEKFTNKSQTTKDTFEVLPVSQTVEKQGLVKIQDGCNNFCSYCIIPYARGRSRSMPVDEVLKQISVLNDENV